MTTSTPSTARFKDSTSSKSIGTTSIESPSNGFRFDVDRTAARTDTPSSTKRRTILLPRRPVAPVTKTFFILNSRLRPETSLCRIALFQTAPKLIKNKDSLRSHTAIAENTVTPSFAYFIGRSQCQFKLFPLNQAAKSEIF